VASKKETPRRRGEEEAWRERSREFTTYDKHKFVLLSTIFIYYFIVLVFEEWTHDSNRFGVRERKERGRATEAVESGETGDYGRGEQSKSQNPHTQRPAYGRPNSF
jgi:hypothetical protein